MKNECNSETENPADPFPPKNSFRVFLSSFFTVLVILILEFDRFRIDMQSVDGEEKKNVFIRPITDVDESVRFFFGQHRGNDLIDRRFGKRNSHDRDVERVPSFVTFDRTDHLVFTVRDGNITRGDSSRRSRAVRQNQGNQKYGENLKSFHGTCLQPKFADNPETFFLFFLSQEQYIYQILSVRYTCKNKFFPRRTGSNPFDKLYSSFSERNDNLIEKKFRFGKK